MKKEQTKRVWTPQQKAEIVHKHLEDHISVRTLEKEYKFRSEYDLSLGKEIYYGKR